MRENQRIGMLLGLTAVLFISVISFVQAQTSTLAEESGGPITYLPVIMTPSCEILFDDFSDPDSGWPEVDDPGVVLTEYINDEYRVLSRNAGIKRPISPAPALENYTVAADVHFDAAPTNGLIGLVFGVQANINDVVTDYYTFVVLPETQEYALFRLERTGSSITEPFDIIVIQGLTISTAVNTGTAVNHLEATRDGTQIRLSVNSTDLGTWNDGNITGLSFVGVAVNPNPSNVDADGRFDNFSLDTCDVSNTRNASASFSNQQLVPDSISDPVNLIQE